MDILDNITSIPLIGNKYSVLLEKLNIKTVEDILYHFPFRYEDYTNVKKISELTSNETATVYAKVQNIKTIYTKGYKKITKALAVDETGEIQVMWFNQPFLAKTIKAKTLIGLSGKVTEVDKRIAYVGPDYEIIKDTSLNRSQMLHTGRLVPIYPETRGITSKWLRSRIKATLDILRNGIVDWLPKDCVTELNFGNLELSFNTIHFPINDADIQEVFKRFAFEEMFLMHLKSLERKKLWNNKILSHQIRLDSSNKKVIDEFIKSLPFELTEDQMQGVDEILIDVTKKVPMNRLLEGDVGSGKTIVSAVPALLTFLNGQKTIYAAPTEILANQHYETLTKYLSKYNAKVGLLTGSKKHADNCNIIVGTHALLYNKEILKDSAFVVIDEQHKFGVEQRAKLMGGFENNKTPHLLTMTATPIPRSLALTVYGDLDLSLIQQMPKNRQKVTTWVVPNNKRQRAYEWIENKIKTEDIQAFVICPLIDESEIESMKLIKSAKLEYEKLQKVFSTLKIGLVHGKMKPKEKEENILKFRNKDFDILVATSVVEVGIDIPNANIILIETADRFGLASLHQLRGRVGRGNKKAYCLLFSEALSPKAYTRLKYMERYTSGIKLAEADMKFRGPGDIYGTMQHGILSLKVANIFDVELMEKTRTYAQKYIDKLDQYPLLKEKVARINKSAIVKPN